ncbi:hypothetical protein PINS_up022277 [Pythium insidiosum]|nr:hypothetical protein PINS_up022277 [Pythium insidiosum]
MMETQETREWAYREAEIDELHEQRVELLRHALQERDKENEFLAEQRLEVLRQRLLHEKENTMERIQQERVTALRKLTRSASTATRRRRGATCGATSLPSTPTLARACTRPVTRGGKAGKVEIRELGIEREQFPAARRAPRVRVGDPVQAAGAQQAQAAEQGCAHGERP